MAYRLSKATCVVAALALIVPGAASAHRPWLKPAAAMTDGKWISIDGATSEHLFDFDSFPLKLDGLTITAPDGKAVTPDSVSVAHMRTGFDVPLDTPGTYRIALVTDTVMARYNDANGQTQRFRGTAAEFAKAVPANAPGLAVSHMVSRVETFVDAGKSSAIVPTGQGLELIPESDPGQLTVDDAAKFKFLLDGKPAANLAVSIIPGGVRYREALKDQLLTTDVNGEIVVHWPVAETYLIAASFPPRSKAADDDDGPKGDAPKGDASKGGGPKADGKVGMGGEREMVPLRVSYAGTFEVLPN